MSTSPLKNKALTPTHEHPLQDLDKSTDDMMYDDSDEDLEREQKYGGRKNDENKNQVKKEEASSKESNCIDDNQNQLLKKSELSAASFDTLVHARHTTDDSESIVTKKEPTFYEKHYEAPSKENNTFNSHGGMVKQNKTVIENEGFESDAMERFEGKNCFKCLFFIFAL